MSGPLHVHRFGPSGPGTVLALHGLTGHGARWRTLFDRHLPDQAALAPDLLGHGRSSWDAPWTIEANVAALAALLETGAAGPVPVVGHSFGGAVALTLAAVRPDLVSGVLLLDPAVALDGAWMREIADRMLADPDHADRAAARADKVDGSWGEVDPAELDRELDEHLIELPGGRVGWRVSLAAAVSYWSELTRPVPVLAAGTRVTLVRATRTDPAYATPALLDRLHDQLGTDLAVREWDCDHMVPLARPGDTATALRDLLG